MTRTVQAALAVRSCAVLVALSAAVSWSAESAEMKPAPTLVPLAHLLSQPAEFQGKLITVTGYLREADVKEGKPILYENPNVLGMAAYALCLTFDDPGRPPFTPPAHFSPPQQEWLLGTPKAVTGKFVDVSAKDHAH